MKKFILVSTATLLMLISVAFAYTDISDEVLNDKVETLSKYNIINGYSDGSFKPENPITRAEFCKMVMCATMNDGIEFTGSKFSDVSDNFWAKDYIYAAKTLGVVNGVTETTFAPQANITNEQAAKMMVCSLGYGEEGIAYGGYPNGYIRVARELGIIDESFNGKKVSTRQEIAEMVYNSINVKFYFIIEDEEGIIGRAETESTLKEYHEFLSQPTE